MACVLNESVLLFKAVWSSSSRSYRARLLLMIFGNVVETSSLFLPNAKTRVKGGSNHTTLLGHLHLQSNASIDTYGPTSRPNPTLPPTDIDVENLLAIFVLQVTRIFPTSMLS
jgi:hypothetical protein